MDYTFSITIVNQQARGLPNNETKKQKFFLRVYSTVDINPMPKFKDLLVPTWQCILAYLSNHKGDVNHITCILAYEKIL